MKKTTPFPTHFKIILDQREQFALDDLYEKEPWWREPIELLHAALRRGIAAMMDEAKENRDPHQPTRVRLEATAANADGQRSGVAPPHGIEPYVATPLNERTRQRLEVALSETDLGEEELYEALLNVGLDHTEEVPGALAGMTGKSSWAADSLDRKVRFRALCDRMASGWR